jgi:hypothetical protein
MITPMDAPPMFLCECDSCGRRELRGPRSLVITPFGATATCRACGHDVLVAAARPVAPPAVPAEQPAVLTAA